MTQPIVLLVAGAAAVALAACATRGPVNPDAPREVHQSLAPHALHEDCMKLAPGDRLDYRFTSSAAVAFNVHYHAGNAVVMPIAREAITADSGIFQPALAEDYCLMWEAGTAPTVLDYRVAVRRRAP
jgi:hypothetical protein